MWLGGRFEIGYGLVLRLDCRSLEGLADFVGNAIVFR